ncbi:signal recognition particle-docking protein FtsY [Maridesulfovibrio hydrothermalis]|uniref:Signal recognition particle receptor FtsY n=1 Tax=Maridesulfovibrio hydrothermalis AM13 = DSM 14728 TaxID=1121451 RepID=L0RD09_9BACT|nr:signal recognition particle-docking protein FtsY [Maridesulfovibrio hydrothermalis]CCO24085.1 Signal recognition particle-docking protein FtsY [Maridesulfovibrio hydrothermalis AM13 = DSM 14728]
MGFFSKVKKLWTSPEDRAEQALKEYLGEDTQPEIKAEEAEPKPEAHPEPVPVPEPEPAPEPETETETAPESEPEPAPKPEIPAPPKVETQPEPAPKPEPEPEQELEPEVAEETPAPEVAEPVTPESIPEPVHAPSAGKTKIIEPVMVAKAQPDTDKPKWQQDLTKALQQAEPRLSVWLGLILEGIETAGDDLWERLHFLLTALEAPADEAEDFINRFKDWLEEMDYEDVDEFRSELQYRLALALELEDEEDERSRLFIKLSEGLNKTREQITKRIDSMLSSHTAFDDDFWEEFEEILIMADVGFEATTELVDRMKDRIRKAGETNPENFKVLLRDEIDDIFKVPKRIRAYNPPEVVMMIGVNGVGKTTTIAKLAHRAQMQGRKVLIVAGDTFRAAAIGQLEVWAKRVGAGFFAKAEGSDPAAVAYEAIDYAVKNGYDLMLLDTAGRLHNKTNLMEELLKIRRVLGKKHDEAPHRSVLVIDATTGQNALSQTKIFNESIGVDELILTKLDGTAKGGVMIAVTMQHKIPITHVGLGEKMEDLRPFNGEDFAKALLIS